MAEDDKRREEGVEDGGPGMAYMSFSLMEDLLDKLKLINYDKEFVKDLRIKAVNRHYFAQQTNPGEQFFMFTSLSAWLIRKTGRPFETPQEFDDPNSTISNILDVLRQMGDTIDFPPSKLKQGFGDQAIFVLNRLADEAIKHQSFRWKTPTYPQEEAEEETMMDDDAELTLAKVEEELLNQPDSDEDEDQILGLDDLKSRSRSFAEANDNIKLEEILESNTDMSEWRLEVERVTPQLKITIRNDAKDWHGRLEQMHQYRDGIQDNLGSTQNQLNKLHTDIQYTLEKIGSREKYLNTQLESMLLEFRGLQDQMAQTKEQYRQVSGGVTERSRLLAQVTDELESVKQDMEERGSSMTDGTPLVNIKKALTRLKNDVLAMDVRIGVSEHTLLQASLKNKSNMQNNMNAFDSLSPFEHTF